MACSKGRQRRVNVVRITTYLNTFYWLKGTYFPQHTYIISIAGWAANLSLVQSDWIMLCRKFLPVMQQLAGWNVVTFY